MDVGAMFIVKNGEHTLDLSLSPLGTKWKGGLEWKKVLILWKMLWLHTKTSK